MSQENAMSQEETQRGGEAVSRRDWFAVVGRVALTASVAGGGAWLATRPSDNSANPCAACGIAVHCNRDASTCRRRKR